MMLNTRMLTLHLSIILCIGLVPSANPQQAAPTPDQASNAPSEKSGFTPPRLLFAPEPEFSESSRKYKGPWIVVLRLQVSADGTPQNVTVKRGIGHGFDEASVTAVQHYRFTPATQDGKPIRWDMEVEVNFEVF